MQRFVQLTVELLFGFIGLLIAVKIIGKRQVQQISPFDFISAVVLGELLGNAIYVEETSIFHVLYAITIWTVMLLVIEKIVQKSRPIRRIVEGTPKLIIKRGLIDYKILKKEKLDFGELTSMLRDTGAFSVREVEYAILEPNGIITVIKKPPYDNVKKQDLNIPTKAAVLTLPLIIEGKIEPENLSDSGHDENWLLQEVRKQNVQNIEDVLYAEWNQTDGLLIQTK